MMSNQDTMTKLDEELECRCPAIAYDSEVVAMYEGVVCPVHAEAS